MSKNVEEMIFDTSWYSVIGVNMDRQIDNKVMNIVFYSIDCLIINFNANFLASVIDKIEDKRKAIL